MRGHILEAHKPFSPPDIFYPTYIMCFTLIDLNVLSNFFKIWRFKLKKQNFWFVVKNTVTLATLSPFWEVELSSSARGVALRR